MFDDFCYIKLKKPLTVEELDDFIRKVNSLGFFAQQVSKLSIYLKPLSIEAVMINPSSFKKLLPKEKIDRIEFFYEQKGFKMLKL